MKILILGATGRTGKWVLQKAVAKGHHIHVLVRDRKKINPQKNIFIFEGTPIDFDILKEAALACEAIVSVLNISRTSDFPWAKLRTPNTFLSDVMNNMIKLSEELGIKRIIACSAWGVNETFGDLPFWFRWLVNYSNIGVVYHDHGRQEKLLINSSMDWTIVRPVGLSNSVKSEEIRISYNNEPRPKLIIGRKQLGCFMIGALDDNEVI